MTTATDLVFYHSPNTRSSATAVLLEELGAPYSLAVLDNKRRQQRQPAYLAINPMGKVPAIVHRGELVTETVAIFIYLADAYPAAKLAPAIGDELRGPYLRWLAFYAACFEPAVVDRALKREPGPEGVVPYGDWDTMLATLKSQLQRGPYLLADRYTAADVLWATGLAWTMMFEIVPKDPLLTDYVERIKKRPAFVKAKALDDSLSAKLETDDQGSNG